MNRDNEIRDYLRTPHVANVRVEGSIPFARSNKSGTYSDQRRDDDRFAKPVEAKNCPDTSDKPASATGLHRKNPRAVWYDDETKTTGQWNTLTLDELPHGGFLVQPGTVCGRSVWTYVYFRPRSGYVRSRCNWLSLSGPEPVLEAFFGMTREEAERHGAEFMAGMAIRMLEDRS